MNLSNKIATTLTAATLAASITAQAQAATLTMSNWVPPAHFVSGILKDWADDVKEATDGRVEIRILPKAVGSPPQHWELARKGVADITWGNWTYEPERFKAVWFAEVPGVGDSAEASSLALWDTYEKYLDSNSAFDGVKVLGVGTLGPGVINHGSKAMVNPSDFENQKFRMGGPIQKVLIESLGAIPVAAPGPKAYEMLNSGVIDGSLHPMESVVNFRVDGVKVLGVGTLGPGVINHGSKAMVNPSDFENQKFRMGGPIQKVLIESLGAIPVAAPGPKAYEMLNSGVIDGSLHPMESVVNFRVDGVLTNHTKIPGGFYDATFFLAMNEGKFNKLSAADQKAVMEVSGAAFARLWGSTFDSQSAAAEEKLRTSKDHTFSEPSKELLTLISNSREQLLSDWAADAVNFGINNPMEMVKYHQDSYRKHAAK